MIQGKRISVGYIIEKVYRDLGINQELPFDDLVEWISEALLFIGAFDQFEDKIVELTVTNNKAPLPCDFYKLKTLTANNNMVYYAGKSVVNDFFCDDCKIPVFPNINTNGLNKETFYINETFIVTSMQSGTMCMDYIAIPLDENGYPTVPNDVSYMKACSSYITKMLDYREWRKGRIADKVFQHSEKEWDWYCGQAKGSAYMPDLAKLEQLKNVIVRLIPQQNEAAKLYRNLQDPEAKKIQ